jgi:hypothetical protein
MPVAFCRVLSSDQNFSWFILKIWRLYSLKQVILMTPNSTNTADLRHLKSVTYLKVLQHALAISFNVRSRINFNLIWTKQNAFGLALPPVSSLTFRLSVGPIQIHPVAPAHSLRLLVQFDQHLSFDQQISVFGKCAIISWGNWDLCANMLTLQLHNLCFGPLSQVGSTTARCCKLVFQPATLHDFKAFRMLLPDYMAVADVINASHPFYVICTGSQLQVE